jgi:DNA-directed RNA polymerase specialized sigma subunit
MPDIHMSKIERPAIISLSDHRPALSRDEERELIQKARRGDQAAKGRLVIAFDRLVRKLAGSFRKDDRIPGDDIIAAGRMGLIEAINRFDLEGPWRLSTYARHYIVSRMRLAVRDWAAHGLTSDSAADRWLASHRGATAEQIVEAIGCSRESALLAVAYSTAMFQSFIVEDDDGRPYPEPKPAASIEEMYDAFNQSKSMPWLGFENACQRERLLDRHVETGKREYLLEIAQRRDVTLAQRNAA